MGVAGVSEVNVVEQKRVAGGPGTGHLCGRRTICPDLPGRDLVCIYVLCKHELSSVSPHSPKDWVWMSTNNV